MSTAATQLQFAAEFTLFLVAVAGLGLAIRPRLVSTAAAARALLGAGFLTIGLSAFLRGSLTIDRMDHRGELSLLRVAGAALVACGCLRWAADRVSRIVLLAGLSTVVVAGALEGRASSTVVDVVLVVGALGTGAALVVAGRRSIPVRIGTSAAGLLLVVVLAVSLALSVVLTRNVEREALRRYGSRTADEAEAASAAARGSLTAARLVGGAMAGRLPADLAVFSTRSSSPAARAGARARLDAALITLTGDQAFAIDDPVLYVSPTGVAEAAAPRSIQNATRLALAGNEVVGDARANQGPRQAVTVVAGQAYAVAAVPVFVRSGEDARRFTGVVVVATDLDDTYLRVRGTGGEPLSFALVTASAVLARSGVQPPVPTLLGFGRRVVDGGERPSGTVGDRFVVARPVGGEGLVPEMALVTSVPTSTVADTREALFRTLFLVALGAALVAVALAVFVGERIGGGVRRLTAAAERIRGGDLDTGAAVERQDELGVLGATFDSMAGSIRSMTGDLRRAADDEARLRGRLQTVVGGMGEAVVACDRSGLVTDCNPAAEELLGLSAREAVGRPLGAVVRFVAADGDDPIPFGLPEEEGEGTRSGEGVVTATGTVVGGDGRAVPVVVTAAALRDPDGSRAGSVLVLRDVRREQEVERMKTEFLANISHELRTPLTPIKGYAGVMRRREVSAEQASAFAGEISAGVDQLERVIAQLVNFATAAAGRLDLHREPVAVHEVVDGVVTRWRARVGDSHRIARRVRFHLPPVQVDRPHLDQALDELVDNAVKYSPEGGRITVVAEAGPSAPVPDGPSNGSVPATVRISVVDRGVGVDPERLGSLVTEFAQGDGSATRRFGGLGLGLAFADRVVRAHGGTLSCESKPGSGARFYIVLPVEPAVGSDREG